MGALLAMGLPARALLVLAAVAALLIGWHRLTAYHERIGYERAQAECAAAALAQREANRARADAAQVRYVERERVRVETITETITEVRDATPHLADCRLGTGAVRLLNDAAASAAAD